MAKVWFITGSSKGFGNIWAEAALERGDQVVATARNASTLQPLVDRFGDQVLALPLDVTDKPAVESAIGAAIDRFGRLDVVVNNAGYGLFGMVEEVSEAEARAQLETNLFGALWVTQAALPQMRKQRSGHILQVSSIGGVNAFPTVGLYHASKWGLEGFSQSLAQEVAGFGIHVTLIEPKGYSTDWAGPSSVHAERIDDYADVWAAREASFKASATSRGVPEATSDAIFAVVDADEPPLRLFLGDGPLEMIKTEYAKRLDEWERWNDVAVAAQGFAQA